MRSGSYMQLSATVKKPPFSSRTPPVQSNTMPAFSRHPASLPLSAPVPAAFGSPEDRFSSVVSHRRGVSGGSAVRRRLRCSRMLIHPRTLIVASMFSLFLVAYWTSYLSTASFSLDGILKKKQRDKEQSRQTEIDIHQILYSADLLQFARTTHTAVYIWCDDDDAFTYLNYLSIASVMRFYNPDQLIILYETRPPSVSGNWISSSSLLSSSSDQFAALMSRCSRRYHGPMKMKNGTMVCKSRRQKQPTVGAGNVEQSDGGKYFYEFVTRLLLQYGGLYIGHRTFMTEVATYFRLVGAVNEHMLSYHSYMENGQGFVFVREPIVDRPPTSPQPATAALFAPAPGAPVVPTTYRPDEAPPGVEVRYYTSREIGCYEGRNFSIDALQMTVEQKVSLYACAVMCEGTPASRPYEVLALKSDFGRTARKAVFNIHDDWETKYYLKAVNGSAVPPLCYF